MKRKVKIEVEEEQSLEEIKELRKAKERKELREQVRMFNLKKTLILTGIIVFLIIMLVFFCNRTFFKKTYKTSKIELDIPLLMFFIKDDGNEIVFKTYRKSQYVRVFFDTHLNNLSYYKCQTQNFYYDDLAQTAIYSVDVEKGFALKTVTVKYAHGDANCLCLSGLVGREAEEACTKNKS